MKVIWILLMQAFVIAPVFGQFTTPDRIEVNAIKGKILLVETQDEVTRTLMDLRPRPAEQQRYKDGVANFNREIKEAVEKYYKWGTKGFQYMPTLEVEKLVHDGKAGRYAILHYNVQNSYVNPMDIGPVYGGKYTDSVRAFSRSKGFGIFTIQIPGNDRKVKDVFSIGLPVAYPSEGDMIYAIQMIHYIFTNVSKIRDYEVKDFRAEITKNNKLLRNKKRTLMIDKSQVTDKTTIEDLRKEYDAPIEIVDYEKVKDAIISNDSTVAYVMVVPVKTNTAAVKILLRHLVIDAKDGKVLGTARPTRMINNTIAPDITKKEVKEYIEE